MSDSSVPLTVGFIGLGMMGGGMARHVLAKGHSVGLLLRPEDAATRCEDLLAAGARSLATSAEVAAMAEVLIICVTGSPEVEEVVLGQHGILEGIKPGCVVLDCSTSQPEPTRHVAAATLAEAFACASKIGINLDVVCDVIDSGGANSTAFQRLRPYVLEGNDQMFRFPIGNGHKDLRYDAHMTGEARAVSCLGDAVQNTYTVASNQGYMPQFIPHLISSLNTRNGRVEKKLKPASSTTFA